jgi:dephospho-CoA kinase
MLVIGLTGGIGSGKTTVANLFQAKKVPIIDADIIAREVTAPGQPALQSMIDYFGPDIIDFEGKLKRHVLRELIFCDPRKRLWLESLLHPLIQQAMRAKIEQIKAPYCIVVIPLLIETGPYPYIDRILVVDSEQDLQIARVASRDEIPADTILNMIKSQTSRELRLDKADDVISNNTDLANLTNQVEKLHQFYLSLS